jgi:hypothetical protein
MINEELRFIVHSIFILQPLKIIMGDKIIIIREIACKIVFRFLKKLLIGIVSDTAIINKSKGKIKENLLEKIVSITVPKFKVSPLIIQADIKKVGIMMKASVCNLFELFEIISFLCCPL